MMAEWLTAFEHHKVESAHLGRDGQDLLRISQYDLIVVDWDLPDISGIEVLRSLRERNELTPAIMLTGKSTSGDKNLGFNSGADDYITKPFELEELAARIRALLRRAAGYASNLISAGDFTLDLEDSCITRSGVSLNLTKAEFNLLSLLIRNPGQVFSVDSLLNRVWDSDSDATGEAIRSCIKRLRQKLHEDEKNSCIETVHRKGYRFVPRRG